jgi:zinc D-Ala-D-Ala carboxypeptidase
MSQSTALTRRGVFAVFGAILIGGVGASIVVRGSDNPAQTPDPPGTSFPERATEPAPPAGTTKDPHEIDPALDEGPDPGGLTAPMAARVEEAVRAAADQGIGLEVTSGWRSYERQEQLYWQAVDEHGSEEAASRWVLPPEESMHVRGLAVDVGPPEAADWLAKNGWRFGLCRRYDNEPWHFEPTTSPGGTCPGTQPTV